MIAPKMNVLERAPKAHNIFVLNRPGGMRYERA
jgi:hypothetical protein